MSGAPTPPRLILGGDAGSNNGRSGLASRIFGSPVERTAPSHADMARALNTGAPASLAVPELSSIRLCCLFNRASSSILPSRKDRNKLAQSKQAENDGQSSENSLSEDETEDEDEDNEDDDEEVPSGAYFRAVKMSAGDSNTVALHRGRKYLYVSSYAAPTLFMTRKALSNTDETLTPQRKQPTPSSTKKLTPGQQAIRSRLQKKAGKGKEKISRPQRLEPVYDNDDKESEKEKKKKDKNILVSCPYTLFDERMVKEEHPRKGRIGVYELKPMVHPTRGDIRRLRKMRNEFLVCLPSSTDEAKNETKQSPSSNAKANSTSQSEPAATISSDRTETETENIQSTSKPSPQKKKKEKKKSSEKLLPCRCELVKIKALMLRDMTMYHVKQHAREIRSAIVTWRETRFKLETLTMVPQPSTHVSDQTVETSLEKEDDKSIWSANQVPTAAALWDDPWQAFAPPPQPLVLEPLASTQMDDTEGLTSPLSPIQQIYQTEFEVDQSQHESTLRSLATTIRNRVSSLRESRVRFLLQTRLIHLLPLSTPSHISSPTGHPNRNPLTPVTNPAHLTLPETTTERPGRLSSTLILGDLYSPPPSLHSYFPTPPSSIVNSAPFSHQHEHEQERGHNHEQGHRGYDENDIDQNLDTDAIEEHLEGKLKKVRGEWTKSQARVRLLTAVRDMISVMTRRPVRRRRSSFDEDENGENGENNGEDDGNEEESSRSSGSNGNNNNGPGRFVSNTPGSLYNLATLNAEVSAEEEYLASLEKMTSEVKKYLDVVQLSTRVLDECDECL